jgi:CoA:oxalate CoA-transferase
MEYKKTPLLEGIRVLDVSNYFSGPLCTMLLSDFGAEVLLVERPDRPLGAGPYIKGERIYNLNIFRGKKSVTLNLKNENDKEIFFMLSEQADVLVENFKPGVMKELGLGYKNLKKRNKRLIYAAISGFGQTGPYKARGAMDVVIQAMSGMMSLTGEPDGKPIKTGPSISDTIAGLFCTIAVLGDLYHRKKSDEGQFVDISMLDCSFACLENAVANYFSTGEVPGRVGNKHPSIAPFQSFKTSDGEIFIATTRAQLFKTMCKALDIPALAEDPRFNSPENCRLNLLDLEKEITRATSIMTMKEVEKILSKAGIPVGCVNNVDVIARDPQITAREMVWTLSHPLAGEYKVAGNPIKMSETTPWNTRPSPLLGQHTSEVLKDLLHLPDDEIENIFKRQATIANNDA